MVIVVMTPDGDSRRLAQAVAAELGWRRVDARRSEREVQAAALRALDRREQTVIESPPLARAQRTALVDGRGPVRFVVTSDSLPPGTHALWSDEDGALTVSADPDPAAAVQAIRREFGV
jgi:hypothetical protein